MLKSKKNEIYMGDKILGIMFIICMLIFLVANIVVKDKDKSEEENRSLAQQPDFLTESIVRGDYMEDFEDYLSDQSAGRNTFRNINTFLKTIGGSREENNIFLGKNGWLMRDIEEPEKEALLSNIDAINDFVEQTSLSDGGIKSYMLLVPDCAEILADSLPRFAVVDSQREMFDMVKEKLTEDLEWIDGISILSQYKDEKIYYKTDHHWTTLGAWHMFSDCRQILGIDEPCENDIYTVTEDFNGTLSSSSGFCRNEEEKIEVYIPKDREVMTVLNYVDEQKKTTSLYDTSMLNTKDKYGVFLGGNSSLIDIRTTAASDKTILVIKDSFANSFIPFLVPYYKEIIVVDPRYYAGIMENVLNEYDIDEALFLYCGNSFVTDNHIAGFLENNNRDNLHESEEDFTVN